MPFTLLMRVTRACLVGSLFLTFICGSHAEPADGLRLISLHNGINSVDLDGAGLNATVVLARRDNFNAHSFEVSTVYAMIKSADYDQVELKIVPIRRSSGKDRLHLITGGGADCVLEDFRLLADPAHHSAVLITAQRKFGDSFFDSQPVTFTYYKLIRNADGEVGSPALYFGFDKKRTSQKKYCDVDEAFESELKIAADKGQTKP